MSYVNCKPERIKYPNILIGYVKGYSRLGNAIKEAIYLRPPSWDCDWYWAWGYLGNKDRHYHVDGLTKSDTYNFEKKVFEYKFHNLYDGFKKHFSEGLEIPEESLSVVCDIFKTFYILKHTAETLGRGGAYYAKNPVKDIIINYDEVKRINEVVLPALFKSFYDITLLNQKSKIF